MTPPQTRTGQPNEMLTAKSCSIHTMMRTIQKAIPSHSRLSTASATDALVVIIKTESELHMLAPGGSPRSRGAVH